MFTATTIREQASRAGRVVQVVRRQPSWVGRFAGFAGLLVLAGVVILLIVPALLVMIAVFLVGTGIAMLRSMFTRTVKPNGALDGRRNVRVIVRDGE